MWTALLLLLGFLAGVGVVWWWLGPTWRALREAARVTASQAQGDWRERAQLSLDAGEVSRVARPARLLIDQLNRAGERTLRRLKDLARQQSDLFALVDALPDPILLADTRRKIILINAPAAALLGISKQKALDQPLEAVVTEPAVLSLFDRVASIALEEKGEDGAPTLPLRKPVRLSRAGRPLSFQAVATRSAAGGVLVVLRDISTLDKALRMKADFVANAGHELRTPVSAIKAAYETLAEAGPGDARIAARCMTIMGGHLQRLEEMLRDLLDLSRVESGEAKPVWDSTTAGQLARDVQQLLGADADKKQVRLRLPIGDQATFVTDYRLLMLAVKNLVENAIKYTPPGGEVELTLQPADQGPTDAAKPVARIIIRDTGVGIPREHLDRVFERFYQVDPARTGTNPRTSGRGTGLGLSIVKHAISALGGTVRVDSEAGVGSTFTITLPQSGAAAG